MNYYEVLGVSPDAPLSEIIKAKRKLAAQYHPDKNLDSNDKQKLAEKFNAVIKAFEVLSDETHRKIYDLSEGVDIEIYERARNFFNGRIIEIMEMHSFTIKNYFKLLQEEVDKNRTVGKNEIKILKRNSANITTLLPQLSCEEVIKNHLREKQLEINSRIEEVEYQLKLMDVIWKLCSFNKVEVPSFADKSPLAQISGSIFISDGIS